MRNNNGATIAYVGIGSNLGDREANLRRALALLVETPQLEVRHISPMIDNPAMGGPDDSPRFLNAADGFRRLSYRSTADYGLHLAGA